MKAIEIDLVREREREKMILKHTGFAGRRYLIFFVHDFGKKALFEPASVRKLSIETRSDRAFEEQSTRFKDFASRFSMLAPTRRFLILPSSPVPRMPQGNPLPKGNQTRWLFRTFGLGRQYKPVPLPPKPYDSDHDKNIAVNDRAHEERLAGVDPEKPHYRDPQYESRKSVPIFDFFGFNRDWSLSLSKLSVIIVLCMIVKEIQAAMVLQEMAMHMVAEQPTPDPSWARDDRANEKELREAGFALIGYKQLDNVGKRKDDMGK